jgi:hypothetical protein
MKKDKIEAGGDQLTAPQMKKKNLPPPNSIQSEGEETPDPDIHIPSDTLNNMQLLHWLNSFPHTLPDPTSSPSADCLCWLLECHKSQQLPPSLQQAHWPELLDLEYPLEEEHSPLTLLEILLEEEEDLVETLLEIWEEEDCQQDPLKEPR